MDSQCIAFETADQVFEFWFGTVVSKETLCSLAYIQERMSLWFAGKSEVFDEMQRRNTAIVHRVGEVGNIIPSPLGAEWDTPRGLLARIILLDQFTRCIFRGTAAAFQYDDVTALIVKRLFDDGTIASNTFLPIERFFLGVAIQHAEDIEMQRIGVQIAALVCSQGASDEVRDFFLNLKGYPHEHHDVIECFGRFPSRNEALGRESTAEEISWLESPECPAWAKSQRKKDSGAS